jgi:sterol desaturase/sphingolipid hydroxylase (fatty acid hydroxylase superfamily)
MDELLESTAAEILLGLVIGGLALALPFRDSTRRPTWRWDIAAAIASVAFAVAAEALLDAPEGSLMARLDGWYAVPGRAPVWLVVPAYIVLADFGAYWAHRALHTPWLWPTHAWHHSPKHLYWVAGLRGSPVHMLVLYAPYYLAFALFPVPEAGLIAAVMFVIDTSNQHYIHSNLKVPWAAWLERVLVTPRLHFVHHSAKPHVANSNYGFIFSVWDRVFGTYTDPGTIPLDDPLGLGYEVSGWRLMLGLPPPRAPREIPAPRAYAGGAARIESELVRAPSARGE